MKQSIHQHAKAPTLKRVIRKPSSGAANVGAGLPAIPRTPLRHAIAGKPSPTGRFNHFGKTPGWVSMDYHG
jgi:hypothetical protein